MAMQATVTERVANIAKNIKNHLGTKIMIYLSPFASPPLVRAATLPVGVAGLWRRF